MSKESKTPWSPFTRLLTISSESSYTEEENVEPENNQTFPDVYYDAEPLPGDNDPNLQPGDNDPILPTEENNASAEDPADDGDGNEDDDQNRDEEQPSYGSLTLYNTNEVPQINGQLIQRPPPRKHNIVYFVHRHHGGKWVRATLLSNELRGYRYYYNIAYDNGVKDGVYLKPGDYWTLGEINDDEQPNQIPNRVINFDDINSDDQPPGDISSQ